MVCLLTDAEHGARRRRWDGREELGRREAGRGGMRRGKKAWVVEVEQRTRGVTEPPDGPAPRQELTTAFVNKIRSGNSPEFFLEKRTEEQNGLRELLLSGEQNGLGELFLSGNSCM